MQELQGKTAVVTGAASGIGRALAGKFAAEGMHVVMADVEQGPLEQAADEVRSAGVEVLAIGTDVSDRASVDALAAAVVDRFGPPHVLCNNAGVSGGGGALWETTENDWKWVLGVNLMGVVHGIQAFLPAMVASGAEGHVVNTSSVLGLSTGPGSIYGVTKHAVTRLSEGLWYDLQAARSPIGVSVLCPGMIATQIISSGRNRPAVLTDAERAIDAEANERIAFMEKLFQEQGMQPAQVADIVVDAIRERRFYVLTHDGILEAVEARMRSILEGTDPPEPNPGLLAGLRGR